MYMLLLILLPVLGGLTAGILGLKKHSFAGKAVIVTLLAELALSLLLIPQNGLTLELADLCGLGLNFQLNGLQIILAILASILWAVSGLGSQEEMERSAKGWRYNLFLLLTLGAIQGVFLSADLYTTLVFFEIMSFTSYVLVMHNEDEAAMKASGSYLTYAVIGGLVSLLGLFLLWNMLGTLRYDELTAAAAAWHGSRSWLYLAGGLSLVTFAAKICMYPLHTWLPGAYREAPAPATALLSGIITKAGMFGVLAITAKLFFRDAVFGQVLLVLAVITMLWGGVQALCQSNLKTTLAWSSMSQIGFILVGVSMSMILGEENGIAVWGSVLHLVNHAWIKLVLFLFAGLIFASVRKLELSDIQGFGRGKKQLMFLFLMPALGVMGVPVWNGYVSKTLIHESIVEYIDSLTQLGEAAGFYRCAEWLFLLAGGMTVAYMAKLFVCIFVEKNHDPEVQKKYDQTPVHGSALLLSVLTVCASLCPVLGLTPHLTLESIAKFAQGFFGSEGMAETVRYFSFANLKGSLISVAFGVLIYFLFVRIFVRRKAGESVSYQNPWPAVLSLEDSLYRPVLLVALPFVGAVIARFGASLFEWLVKLCNRLLFFRAKPTVTPPEDEKFASYDPAPQGRRGNGGTLAHGLTLFALGYMLVMAYLLLSNFVF